MNPPPSRQPVLGCDYWEDQYRRGDTRWDKGEPSPGLVDFLGAHPELPRGSVAIPGCGMGHDVRAWARAGFEAVGLDLAPSAVERADALTREAGLSARFVQADFLHGAPLCTFDWIWEHTLFCAIHPTDRDAYVAAVGRWLRPGGHYLAVHYLIPDEDGPPFGTNKEELLRRFSPQFELLESWVPRSYPNRTGLELVCWWRLRSS